MRTIKNLQALRALGAILIFTHHFGFQNNIVESFGDCGVCWFLMLSGYVNYGVLQRNSSYTKISISKESYLFMKKRIFKIAPLYYAGLVLSLIIGERTYSLLSVSATTLMIQSWIPMQDVFFGPNAPAWFISTLLFCLLWLPIINRFTKEILFNILTGLIFIYFCVIILLPDRCQLYWIYIFPPMQFISFFIGITIWHINLVWRKRISSTNQATFLQFSSWSLIIILIYFYRYVPYSLKLSSYWWICTAYLIIILTITDSTSCIFTKIMHLSIIQKMGNASLSFYLLHIPWIFSFRILIQHLSGLNIINDIPKPIEFTLSLFILWCISLAIHHYFYPHRK